MSQLEHALRKLKLGDEATPPARIAMLSERRPSAGHRYGGQPIQIDLAALQLHGLLSPDSDARLAEEYRIIKRPLLSNADSQAPVALGNLLMVTSALSGEGKTFTCVNLSLSLAQEEDWDVVLVDADCSRPRLTQLLSAEEEPGLLDLLREPELSFESVVMPTDVPGVSFLPVGSRRSHSSELLASRRMRELCIEISAKDPQRVALFDSAPLLLTSEAPILASQVGQIVLVVRSNNTPREAVVSALDIFDEEKPVSCILNMQSGSLGSVYGYYGYGHYGQEDQTP